MFAFWLVSPTERRGLDFTKNAESWGNFVAQVTRDLALEPGQPIPIREFLVMLCHDDLTQVGVINGSVLKILKTTLKRLEKEVLASGQRCKHGRPL